MLPGVSSPGPGYAAAGPVPPALRPAALLASLRRSIRKPADRPTLRSLGQTGRNAGALVGNSRTTDASMFRCCATSSEGVCASQSERRSSQARVRNCGADATGSKTFCQGWNRSCN